MTDEHAGTRAPTGENIATDTAALRATVQAAVGVELFTIPLYMTALYSIYGTYPAGQTFDDEGANPSTNLWPGLTPMIVDLESSEQIAFDLVFSVFMQEMLHLQLAANLANAVGQPPGLAGDAAPVYDDRGVPCIGPVPGIEVLLGPLDDDRIKLFEAIETPDWDAADKDPPAVPYAGWSPGDDLPEYGTIGHLYTCLHEYIDLTYSDGSVLWDKVYEPGAVQVDIYDFVDKGHPYPEYPSLPVKIDPTSSSAPRDQAHNMIAAIVAQGEGGGAGVSKWIVPRDDRPDLEAMKKDWSPGADVREKWDRVSHYRRFEKVKALMNPSRGGVSTFPSVFTARSPRWSWEDLVASDPNPAAKAFAQKRAHVLNGDTASIDGRPVVAQLTHALNQSYSNLLHAMELAWADAANPFPTAAMQALNTRVTALWAAGGDPSPASGQSWFVWTPAGAEIPKDKGHACQGLDPANPGTNDCAASVPGVGAVVHTCGGANSCENQGGCGYPGTKSVPNTELAPDHNTCANQGGCGAPIPVAQVFNEGYSGTVVINGETVSYDHPGPVYETAWEVFKARFGHDGPPPDPNPLRLVIPPS